MDKNIDCSKCKSSSILFYIIVLLLLASVGALIYVSILYSNTNSNCNNKSIEKFTDMECSKKCCKFTDPNTNIYNQIDPKYLKYVKSNFTCDGGCLCMTSQDIDYLSSRGGNSNANISFS